MNKELCGKFKQSFTEQIQRMSKEEKDKPTALVKAFYDNLNLVNLFPLLESDFDVELGGDNWKEMIGKYKLFGSPQRLNIPSFDLLNSLFDPKRITAAHQAAPDDFDVSIINLEELEKSLGIERVPFEALVSTSSQHSGSTGEKHLA